MRHQSHAEISAKTVYERLFQLVIIPTIVFTSDRRTNFICLGRNISDTRHMCHPDLASVHHGAVVEKNAECLFWWAWFCSVHFLWATAPEPIFLHSLSPRPVNSFFAMRQWRGGTKRDASAQVYKCVNYMFNIVGKLVMERRRRTEEEGRKEGKFARRWRERTWKELVSICVMHFVFPSSSVTLG